MNRLVPHVVLTLTLAASVPACAWNDCDHRADREATAELSGIERIEVQARAGDLRLEGRDGVDRMAASGNACASSRSLLDAIQIKTERSGTTLKVIADIPKSSGWNKQARLDLEIVVPATLPVDVDDSSGDFSAEGVTLGRVEDGSGDLSFDGTFGTIKLEDGSGDIRIVGHRGDIELEDGSGDARLSNISGSIRVRDDGSGDLTMETVSGSVEVRNDGSGDIFAGGVGGDFIVDRAGSGDVRHREVAGRVQIPTRD